MRPALNIQAYLDQVPENLYGHRHKLQFVANAILDWKSQSGRDPKVLDVGCGTGAVITVHLARLQLDVTGIDTDAPSITRAQQLFSGDRVTFRTGALVQEAGPFDVVLLTEVLEHLHDPGVLLRVIRSKISNDGLLIVTVPNGYGPFELEKWLWRRLHLDEVWTRRLVPFLKRLRHGRSTAEAYSRALPENSLDESPHVQFFTPSSMKQLLSQNGFDVVSIGKSSLIAGPFSSLLLPSWQALFRLNTKLGSIAPRFMVNGHYYAARPDSSWPNHQDRR